MPYITALAVLAVVGISLVMLFGGTQPGIRSIDDVYDRRSREVRSADL